MLAHAPRLAFVALLLCVVSPARADEPPADAQALRAALLKMDAMRQGPQTRFAEVERLGKELLARYKHHTEQGMIYYQVAHVLAQSDIRGQAAKITEYANAALKHERDPVRRALLHTYIGCAAEVDPARMTAEQRRRRAVRAYLEGYAELVALKLPDRAPELPVFNKLGGDLGPDPAAPIRRAVQRDAQMKARREAEVTRELVHQRDILVRQISELYRRFPAPGEELRRLAEQTLPNREAVDDLLTRVSRK